METVSTVPLIPTKSLQETAAQLTCKPSCSCGGRGWTGVIETKDGPMLVKCRHADFAKTDFVLAIEHMDVLNENIKAINKSMNEQLDVVIKAVVDCIELTEQVRLSVENTPFRRMTKWIHLRWIDLRVRINQLNPDCPKVQENPR